MKAGQAQALGNSRLHVRDLRNPQKRVIEGLRRIFVKGC